MGFAGLGFRIRKRLTGVSMIGRDLRSTDISYKLRLRAWNVAPWYHTDIRSTVNILHFPTKEFTKQKLCDEGFWQSHRAFFGIISLISILNGYELLLYRRLRKACEKGG